MDIYKKVFIFLFFSIFVRFGYGQIDITGYVLDSTQTPIPFASVMLQSGSNNIIVAYAITNKAGYYLIKSGSKFFQDSLTVRASAIGYKESIRNLEKSNYTIMFTLLPQAKQLPTLTIKNKKSYLKFKEDTLSYKVDSFVDKQDITIGDVLKKLPGVDVDANGKISYNGKTISNFYIDGDNLLDDRYNLATKSLPADIVSEVQILENHQPIRVLKNAATSDNIGLNLRLKNNGKFRLIGRAEIGGGVSEKVIFDETSDIIAFKKQYKAINSFRTNNSGIDVSNDVVSHNLEDYLNQIDNKVPRDLLDLNNPPPQKSLNRDIYLMIPTSQIPIIYLKQKKG